MSKPASKAPRRETESEPKAAPDIEPKRRRKGARGAQGSVDDPYAALRPGASSYADQLAAQSPHSAPPADNPYAGLDGLHANDPKKTVKWGGGQADPDKLRDDSEVFVDGGEYEGTTQGMLSDGSGKVVLPNGVEAFRVGTGSRMLLKLEEGEQGQLYSTDFSDCGATVIKAKGKPSEENPDAAAPTYLLMSHVSADDEDGHWKRVQEDISYLKGMGASDLKIHLSVRSTAQGENPKDGMENKAAFYTMPSTELVEAKLRKKFGNDVTVSVTVRDIVEDTHLVVTPDEVVTYKGEFRNKPTDGGEAADHGPSVAFRPVIDVGEADAAGKAEDGAEQQPAPTAEGTTKGAPPTSAKPAGPKGTAAAPPKKAGPKKSEQTKAPAAAAAADADKTKATPEAKAPDVAADVFAELSAKAHEARLAEIEIKRAKLEYSKGSASTEAELTAISGRIETLRQEAAKLNEEAVTSGARADLAALRDPTLGPADHYRVLRKHRPDATLADVALVANHSGHGGTGFDYSERSEVQDGQQKTVIKEQVRTPTTRVDKNKEVVEDKDLVVTRDEEVSRDYLHGKRTRSNSRTIEKPADAKGKPVKLMNKTERVDQAGKSERTDAEELRHGDDLDKKSKKREVTYDRNGVGVANEKKTFKGKTDAAGNPISGVEDTASNVTRAQMKDGEASVAHDRKRERKHQHNKHLSTKTFGGAGFSVSVKVKKVRQAADVESGTPEQLYFLLVTTVTLRGNFGVGGEATTGGAPPAASAKGGVTAGASGSVSLSVSQRLDEAGTEGYLNTLEQASSGSSNSGRREINLIYVAANEGPNAAYALYKGVKATMGSPEAAKDLKEGESVQLDAKGEVEGGVSGGAKGKDRAGGGGGLNGSLGVTGGVSAGRKILMKRVNGKIVVTLYVTSGAKAGLNGSAGYGPGSVKAGKSKEWSAGRTVQIALDESDPNFQAKLDALTGAVDTDDLNDVMKEQAFSDDELKLDADNQTEKEETKLGAAIGPAGFDIGAGTEWSDEVVIENGEVKRKVRGANSRSGEVSFDVSSMSESAGWLTKQVFGDSKLSFGDKQTDAMDVEIGEDGRVTGNLTGTAEKTGNLRSEEEKKPKVQGINIQHEQWTALYEQAKNPTAWMAQAGGHESVKPSWRRFGEELRATNGNIEAIGVAAARFQEYTTGKGKEHLSHVIRPYGSATAKGAQRFEVGVPGLQAELDSCVWHLPKDYDPTAMNEKLDDIKMKVVAANAAGKFSNQSAVADILASITARKQEIREGGMSKGAAKERMAYLRDPNSDRNDPSMPSGMEWLQEMGELETRVNGKWNELAELCGDLRESEDKTLASLNAMATAGIRNSNALEWGQEVTELRELHGRWYIALKSAEKEAKEAGADIGSLPRPRASMLSFYVEFGGGKTKLSQKDLDAAMGKASKDELTSRAAATKSAADKVEVKREKAEIKKSWKETRSKEEVSAARNKALFGQIRTTAAMAGAARARLKMAVLKQHNETAAQLYDDGERVYRQASRDMTVVQSDPSTDNLNAYVPSIKADFTEARMQYLTGLCHYPGQ